MKKAILTITAALLLTGCIREDRSGCDGQISLTFTYNHTSEEFDDKIGNDVYVRLYRGDSPAQELRAPYETIEGGKAYRFHKKFAGPLNLAAWAVRRSGDPSSIPAHDEQVSYPDYLFHPQSFDRNGETFYRPLDDLYLGTLSDRIENMTDNSDFEVNMRSVVCRLNLYSLSSASLFSPSGSELQVSGCASQCSFSLVPKGPAAIVCADIVPEGITRAVRADASKYILISTAGLLPAYPTNATVQLTAYDGVRKIFSVDSKEVSEPGKRIDIYIDGITAQIIVNGWNVRTVRLDL